MTKKINFILVSFFLINISLRCQTNSDQKQKIAVFAPLYLDSAFDATNNYRYEKNFPKFINPGLEFYEGVHLALDSLNKEKAQLEVFILDTRSSLPVAQQAKELDSTVGLIIAHATAQENWTLADEAFQRKIPYINVNLPNDGGITNNSFFVMLNPSLKTHVEGVYRFLQKYFSLNTIVVFRKKGQMEDMIKKIMDDFSAASVPVKLKYVDLVDSFTVKQLQPHFDSTRQNVCVAATLDDQFSRRLITQLASISKSYKTTIVGMPTLDNISRDFTKKEFHGPEIVYGNPFYNAKMDKVSQEIISIFNSKLYARPSDMVFRGYEVMWKYSKLLAQYKTDLSSNPFDKNYRVFTDFDIQPVLNKLTNTLDYFENKRLYFIRWQDGVIKGVN